MDRRALVVAMVAAGLLVLSLTFDLAFGQEATLSVKDRGEWVTLATGSLKAGDHYGRSPRASESPLAAGRNDTLDVRVQLANGYPWPSSKTFTLTTMGCYDGADIVATVPVSAPPSGSGEGIAHARVKDLGTLSSGPSKPPEAGAAPATQFVNLYVCLGQRYVAQGTLVFSGGTF